MNKTIIFKREGTVRFKEASGDRGMFMYVVGDQKGNLYSGVDKLAPTGIKIGDDVTFSINLSADGRSQYCTILFCKQFPDYNGEKEIKEGRN